ncbi:hypothetical protein HK104_009258 [Borealophlyctis nickersoniae]|nr:hypothetical protein HK104_009258 [Borealophlyctis nickersoniae]
MDICNGAKVLALSCAARRVDAKMVRLVVGAMRNVKVDGGAALCCAAQRGALEIVKILVRAKVDFNSARSSVEDLSPLELAIQRKHVEVVRFLLTAGCRVPAGKVLGILRAAVEDDDYNLVRVLVLGAEWTPGTMGYALDYAIEAENIDIVKLMLDAGAPPDQALRIAICNGNYYMTNLLLNAGADIHRDNDNALHIASRDGFLSIVILLLDAGADVHANDDIVLYAAAGKGHLDIVKFLLAAGANPHTVRLQELLLLAKKRHLNVVNALIEARGDERDCVSLLLVHDAEFNAAWGPLWNERPLKLLQSKERRAELLKVLLNERLSAVHKAVRLAQETGEGNLVLQWAADAHAAEGHLAERGYDWP